MTSKTLKIHPDDNIIVALSGLSEEEHVQCDNEEIRIKENIPAKHKFAGKDFNSGDQIIMYGVTVGKAISPIRKGEKITTDNIFHATNAITPIRSFKPWTPPDISSLKHKTFDGYPRSGGRVGTLNLWLVVPLVFCENRNIDIIKSALLEPLGYPSEKKHSLDVFPLIQAYQSGASSNDIADINLNRSQSEKLNRVFPNIDGIKFLKHEGGCGGTRQDAEALCRLIAGYINNPNVGGATILSLGCQHAEEEILLDHLNLINPEFNKPIHVLKQQGRQSEQEFLEDAIKLTFTGLMDANKIKRQPVPISKLVLGLECGGSDGFSGISANPALGYASDLLVACGGGAILAEFPELSGVEQELINRCNTDAHAKKFIELMETYEQKAQMAGSGFHNNPSPGNIKDGLITDAIKSAGAAKKGGTSSVVDVLDYTEQYCREGLNLLCTPGNDVESTTALAGSGANLIAFTTGLGTPTGNPVCPVVKISSNHDLSRRMGDIIDFNTGDIIDGSKTIEEKGLELLNYILELASGKVMTASMRLGQDDFIPWKRGISL